MRYRSGVDSALQGQLEQGKGGGHGQVGERNASSAMYGGGELGQASCLTEPKP